ncbi:hypothetical protein EDB86DRAFT_2827436 [Lactarius hatsudake]|nr:hypothetical protein EDB86DRAFT_2827436 [Lactarius hatsudake]
MRDIKVMIAMREAMSPVTLKDLAQSHSRATLMPKKRRRAMGRWRAPDVWADMLGSAAENHGPGQVALMRCEYAEEEESSEGSEGPKEFLASRTQCGCADEESADENMPHLANYVQDEYETDGGVKWDLPGPK